jgi:hypothetical protein
MHNETLIHNLETLRDTYTQQQKTATVLQTTFKAFADSQNKTRKALSDYDSQNTGTDISRASETFTTLRLKEDTIDPLLPSLRREIKALSALVSALKDTVTALRSEPVDVVKLDKASTTLQTADQQNIQALLPELNEELLLAQRALGDEFGAKLRDALTQQGLTIGGRAPKFEIGRFELDANFAKRFMTLRYGKDIVNPRISITVDAALKAYAAAAKDVLGRNQDGKSWITQFHDAYQIARRKRNTTEARVNIVECYIELVLLRQGRQFASEPSKRTFTDYTRAQFIHDFYEYANNKRLSINGLVVKASSATKSQTDSPAKSMWVVEGDSPYDGRYIADIEFVKE